MTHSVSGSFVSSLGSEITPAKVEIRADGDFVVRHKDTGETIQQASPEQVSYGDVLPGLEVDLLFFDGSRFTPDDAKYRWPMQSASQSLLHGLETRWLSVVVATVVLPLVLWVLAYRVLPRAADLTAPYLPDWVSVQMSEQTLTVLDRPALSSTQLSECEQQQVRQLWQHIFDNSTLEQSQYTLLFRDFSLGANAFALPDGTVVVTDDFVNELKDDPEGIIAVMLHEIGHVKHQHSLKLATRATAAGVMFALVLGDIEGAGETIIGTATSLLQSAFSREMETQADMFALRYLNRLGIETEALGRALATITHIDEGDAREFENFYQYFSSHPKTLDRIENSKQADQQPRD